MIWMPTIRLVRVEENFRWGTFGNWIIGSRVFCVTLEPADLENRKSVSSIPAQQYLCKRYSSEKYPDTFQIMNVPDRDKVLIHPGNWKEDTEACILLAQYFGKLQVDGQVKRGILNSGKTFKSFMNLMTGIDEFNLTVVECY